jgi:hypothetical protein
MKYINNVGTYNPMSEQAEAMLPLKAISREKYTHLTGLFVRLLRCKNGCIARYAPIFTPCRRTKILRHLGYIYSCLSPKLFRSIHYFRS